MPYDLQPNIWILAKYIRSGPKGSKPLASHARRRRLGFSLSHEDIGNRGKSWRSLASLYKWINGPLIERAFWPVQRCSVAGKKSEQSTKKCHGGSQRDFFFYRKPYVWELTLHNFPYSTNSGNSYDVEPPHSYGKNLNWCCHPKQRWWVMNAWKVSADYTCGCAYALCGYIFLGR